MGDLMSKHIEQSDKKRVHKVHHKHHENVVSEAMGVAFGDSDSAHEEQEVAKLYSTAPKGEDVTDEFWGEEDPSEIDREFTVEGIPMTSALSKDGEKAPQAILNKVDTKKHAKHA